MFGISKISKTISRAHQALELAKENLQNLQSSKAQAEEESKVIFEIYEANRETKKLLKSMAQQQLLPGQLEERLKAAQFETQSIMDEMEELGF